MTDVPNVSSDAVSDRGSAGQPMLWTDHGSLLPIQPVDSRSHER